MTDSPDQPAPTRKRRRAAAPPGHLNVAPASLGQGAQLEATNSNPPKRRAPRKRAAKKSKETVEDVVMAAPSSQAGDHLLQQPAFDAVSAVEDAPEPAAEKATDVVNEAEAVMMAESVPMAATERPTDHPTDHDGFDGPFAQQPEGGVAAHEAGFSQASSIQAGSSLSSFNEVETSDHQASEHQESEHQGSDHPASNDDGAVASRGDGPPDGRSAPPPPPHDPHHRHGWVYAAMGVFVLSLLFGAWGVWTTWFAGEQDPVQGDAVALGKRNDRLSQDIATLRRSDQISREANRDLQRTLAERDEEIAGLRADVAFYERFVGATAQRRGLSVHDLEMQLQSGDAWHFVATLTQNLNRGAVNTGRLTLSVEGTRNERMERLPWTRLRQENNAPGAPYSFKYFQQVEGDVLLPKDFKPLRVIVRLVPAGGAAVEQSFTWAETLDRSPSPTP
jgi:hypothetical protein